MLAPETGTGILRRYAPVMVANGWHVLPLAAGEKFPGVPAPGGGWRPMRNWERLCEAPPTPRELDLWSQWPDGGIGIACGHAVGVDIDIEDDFHAGEVADVFFEELGPTPLIRIGKAPKRLLVYRAETPFRGFKMKPIEVLGSGNQFAALGTHPGTGRAYHWPEENPIDTPIDELEPIAEEAFRRAALEAYSIIPDSLIPQDYRILARRVENPGAAQGSLFGPSAAEEAVLAALSAIPNDSLSRDTWVRIGMALKAAGGESMRQPFLDWSRQSSKSGASGKNDTPERAWESFQPRGRVGFGTIYAIAREHGWQPPANLDFERGFIDS